jgi:hypothetical protein
MHEQPDVQQEQQEAQEDERAAHSVLQVGARCTLIAGISAATGERHMQVLDAHACNLAATNSVHTATC